MLRAKKGRKIFFVEPQQTLATSLANRLTIYNQRLGIHTHWKVQHAHIAEDPYFESPL